MSRALLEGSHRRLAGIAFLIAVLCAAGIYEASRLPSSIFPSVTFPIVKVIADAGDGPAAQMIPAVTRPLEEAVRRVPGVVRVISTTQRGSVEIDARFSWSTNMQVALERVQAEVARVRPDLPAGTRVEAQWMNTAVFPIMGYALYSKTYTQAQLWELAEYRIKPRLLQVPGVSQIQVQGGRQREFQVHLDPAELSGRRLTAADVVAAIRRNDIVESAGLIEKNHELYLSLVSGRARGIGDLENIAVAIPGGGVPATLSDLGTIMSADAVSYVRTTADGHPAVLINVIRQPSGNTVAIARAVEKIFRGDPGLLPAGVHRTTFYDQAEFVQNSVHGVRDAILIGVVLAALVLFAFLRDWKITLVATAIIPVTVALVLLGLSATGQTINLMTMGGIAAAIGLVVDDAIVVVENIARHAEEKLSPNPAASGLAEVFPALTGSSISTVVIFAPFALLSGVTGAFFRPLALTMAIALTVSYLLAAFAVPAAAGRLGVLGRGRSHLGTRAPVAGFFLARPWLCALLTLACLAGGWLLYRAIGTDFLPEMDEGSIVLDYWTPAGTSLHDTNRMLDQVEKKILALPDVRGYSRRTGTQLGFFITEPNTGDYVIRLKRRGARRPVDDVIDDLRRSIARTEPAIRTDFGQLLEDNIGDLSGGTPQPVDVKIFGEDQSVLEAKARAAAAILRRVPGVVDVFDGITIAGPALTIRTDPGALARYGLTAAALREQVQPALTGTVASRVRVGERLYDVRVFTPPASDLASLPIRAAGGATIPLSTVGSVSTGAPEAEIDREDLRSFLGVTARLTGRSLGGAMSEIQRGLAEGLALPAGMSVEYGGLYEQQQASFKGLLGVLFAGLLLVAVVLLFEFGDWRAAFLTVVAALAVLCSIFGSLLLAGMTFNISSFVGAIMMVGIVGEKTVFLINDAQSALRRGLPVGQAWLEASRKRVRAVLMTVFATAFALAPLAVALGEGSQLLQPLAIAVIGGFLLSSPLVLLVVPALYRRLDPRGKLAG